MLSKGLPLINTHILPAGRIASPRGSGNSVGQYTNEVILDLRHRDCEGETTVAMIPVRLLEERETFCHCGFIGGETKRTWECC